MASYEKHPKTKLWSVRYYGKDENGIPRQLRFSGGFKTKKDAQSAFEEYMEKKKEEEKNKPIEIEKAKEEEKDSVLFSALASDFLRHKKTRVKESTYYDISSRLNTRILPFFKDKKIGDITPIMVNQWLDTLSDYSHNYRSTLLTQFCSVLAFGDKYFDLKNISSKIDRPRNIEQKKEMQVWTPEEFQRFIKVVSDPQYIAFYWTLYVIGCRLGEALALTWNDFDFENSKIKINKSFSYKTQKTTSPKNSTSNRTLSLPQYYKNIMLEYKDWQSQNKISTEHVFGGDQILNENTIRRKTDEAAERAGVKRIRIHDFRHSCASLLLHKGVQIVAVSKYLGHANVTQTLNTYGHMMPDDQSMILNALNAIEQKSL
ncbi:MAG: tyrosine-type recombinase/integrase [Clostridia bacterium]|nr:tyrosine-type recombinase/integrase [Clostridia bacterium]